MICYIIGAGASKGYKKSPTNQLMPMAKDFFSTFCKLNISENNWVLIGNIVNYVRDYYKIEPAEFSKFNIDIEVLHSEIHEKFLKCLNKKDFINALRYSSANIQLVFLFVSVINEIQNGPISLMHINLAKSLKPNDSIITFNWDTLIDRALSENSKWNTDTGYFIKPKQIYRNKWINPSSDKSEIELLKLHGSTNWLTSYPIFDNYKMIFTHNTNPDDVFVYERTNDEYACYDGRYMEGYQPFSYGYYPPNLFVDSIKPPSGRVIVSTIMRTGFNPKGKASSQGIISMPLIITPIKNKEYDKYGQLYDNLWNRAEEKIINANKIIIAGYSFPITDTRSRNLFQKAFSKRNNIPEIVIINPNPENIIEMLNNNFGIPIEKIFIDKCFMDENYNFNKFN